MRYTIRTAEKADEDIIRELFLEMLRTIYDTEDVEGYGDGDLDRSFAGKEDRIYVAEDSKVTAFLSAEVHHEEHDYMYLDDLCVTKACRNKGIGTMLVNTAVSYAKERKLSAVLLNAVTQDGCQARGCRIRRAEIKLVAYPAVVLFPQQRRVRKARIDRLARVVRARQQIHLIRLFIDDLHERGIDPVRGQIPRRVLLGRRDHRSDVHHHDAHDRIDQNGDHQHHNDGLLVTEKFEQFFFE